MNAKTTKITRKDIITHRAIKAQSWHDANWHKYIESAKAEAIDYAIQDQGRGASYTAITGCAEDYLLKRH